MMAGAGGLVLDASVLIDYGNCATEILGLVVAHVAPVQVPDLVFAEVDCLTIEDAERLGLVVVETSAAHLGEAEARPRTLSFEDALCFFLARDRNLTCVTSDEALWKHCLWSGVAAIRGLRPLIELARLEVLPLGRCLRIARWIEAENGWMAREVVVAFATELLNIRAGRRTGGS